MNICDRINEPIVVFRGCSLPELIKIAKLSFFVLGFFGMTIMLIVFKNLFDAITYGICFAVFLELPLSFWISGLIGNLKKGKPVNYYDKRFTYVLGKFYKYIGLKDKDNLFIPSGKWCVIREVRK